MYFIFGFSSFIIRWVSEEETRTQRDDRKRPGISMNNHLFPSSFTLTPSNLLGNDVNTQSAGVGNCLCPVCLHCAWETQHLCWNQLLPLMNVRWFQQAVGVLSQYYSYFWPETTDMFCFSEAVSSQTLVVVVFESLLPEHLLDLFCVFVCVVVSDQDWGDIQREVNTAKSVYNLSTHTLFLHHRKVNFSV